MPHTGVCQLHLHGGAAAPGVQSSLKHVRNTTGTHGGTERRKRNDADANCGQGWWLRRSRVLPPVLAILILASGVCMADANASSTATPAPEGTTPAASGTPPPNMTFPMITTTPEGDMSDVNATENSTIVIENITVVNITQVNTEYVVGGSGSGGLDEELNRLVNAFKNPRQFFEATDLDAVAVSTLWATCVFFIFFSIAIALDRSRYKRKYQNNHNLLLLISLITCLNYLTMANGHGRALKHVIKEVKPYNLTRFCEKINQTNVSSTPSPDASSILPGGNCDLILATIPVRHYARARRGFSPEPTACCDNLSRHGRIWGGETSGKTNTENQCERLNQNQCAGVHTNLPTYIHA